MHRLIVALLSALDALIQVAGGLAVIAAPLTALWVFGLGGYRRLGCALALDGRGMARGQPRAAAGDAPRHTRRRRISSMPRPSPSRSRPSVSPPSPSSSAFAPAPARRARARGSPDSSRRFSSRGRSRR